MAENPQSVMARPRPLSPFVTIYHWPVTMAASITHRITGVGLTFGMVFLAWWLIAAAAGPVPYSHFAAAAHSIIGEVILFGFVWAMAFHFLNGIRHLIWDIGYGFKVQTAIATGIIVYVLSVLLAILVFAHALSSIGHA
jgi:succinate dehydrogenase / fumarate reductase, cytochrome b subunit